MADRLKRTTTDSLISIKKMLLWFFVVLYIFVFLALLHFANKMNVLQFNIAQTKKDLELQIGKSQLLILDNKSKLEALDKGEVNEKN